MGCRSAHTDHDGTGLANLYRKTKLEVDGIAATVSTTLTVYSAKHWCSMFVETFAGVRRHNDYNILNMLVSMTDLTVLGNIGSDLYMSVEGAEIPAELRAKIHAAHITSINDELSVLETEGVKF